MLMSLLRSTFSKTARLYQAIVAAVLIVLGFIAVLASSSSDKYPHTSDNTLFGTNIAYADAPYAQGVYGDSGSGDSAGSGGDSGSGCDSGGSCGA